MNLSLSYSIIYMGSSVLCINGRNEYTADTLEILIHLSIKSTLFQSTLLQYLHRAHKIISF